MAVAREAIQVGDRLLELLSSWGVEYIFASPGSELPPLWEALAHAEAEEREAPRLLNCRHEQLAVCLGMGYYRGTGRLPVAMMHTGVGALHTAMVLRSALHERVPMLVLVGQPTSFGEDPSLDIGAQWLRMLADRGGPPRLVEPFVKWSGYAPEAATLGDVLRHAAEVALTPPRGPALVALPLEVFFRAEPAPIRLPALSLPAASQADPDDVRRAATLLLDAPRPLIVTETVGRDPASVADLVTLAEALAAPVVEASSPVSLNFPRDHPLHQGYSVQPLIAEADVVLLAGCVGPWHPPSRWPRAGAQVIALDDDPSQELLPIAGYRADLRLGGSLTATLRQLAGQVGASVDRSLGGEQRNARRRELEERHRRQRASWEAEAQAAAAARPIDSRWLAHALAQHLPPEAILVEESTTGRQAFLTHTPRTVPGTYQVRGTGGLGVMLGTAQGLKVAQPDRLVVVALGDGSLHYSPALANFGFAQEYAQPLLVILIDNGAYVSMRSGHDRLYPEGWAVRTAVHPGTAIEPRPDYPALARAFGGYGERIEDPADVPAAIARGIQCVQGGQWALLDVVTASEDHRAGR